MLEIVEREAIGSRVCAWVYRILTSPCRCQVLVSMGFSVGINAWGDSLCLCRLRDQGVNAALSYGTAVVNMLAEGFQSARLETRTKESNMYASRWVSNPLAQVT